MAEPFNPGDLTVPADVDLHFIYVDGIAKPVKKVLILPDNTAPLVDRGFFDEIVQLAGSGEDAMEYHF